MLSFCDSTFWFNNFAISDPIASGNRRLKAITHLPICSRLTTCNYPFVREPLNSSSHNHYWTGHILVSYCRCFFSDWLTVHAQGGPSRFSASGAKVRSSMFLDPPTSVGAIFWAFCTHSSARYQPLSAIKSCSIFSTVVASSGRASRQTKQPSRFLCAATRVLRGLSWGTP